MLELALHILDIVENSTRAGAKNICINIEEDDIQDILRIDISDNGWGMSHETLEKALDPFYTTKKVRRVGLGLPMLKEAAEKSGGNFSITSEMGVGTTVSVTFGLSNIDRQPLGDIPGVLVALITGNPDVDFRYAHCTRHGCYEMDTGNIRKELEDVPIQRIEVLQFIRRHVQEGLQEIASLA